MSEKWDLLLTLPNLDVPIPTPFQSGGYAICSAEDPLLKGLATNAANAAGRNMLRRFKTTRGESYKPGCLLIRSDVGIQKRSAEAIRAFRNICAISTITAAYASSLEFPNGSAWRVNWSDQFFFGYFVAGKNGWIQTLDGAAKGTDDKVPDQQAAPQFGKPANWRVQVDKPLLDRLFTCWRRCYLQKKNRGPLRRLFRALEVAFHASLFPADGLPSLNDIGTRLALWVSAFEVLCHTGNSVNKRVVQGTLSQAPYSLRALTAKRFTVYFQNKKQRATLPEALYDDLYWARNQFLHGMPVRLATLRYKQSHRYALLLRIAPVLFNVALVSHLNRMGISGGPVEFDGNLTSTQMSDYAKTHAGIRRAQAALAAAGRPSPAT